MNEKPSGVLLKPWVVKSIILGAYAALMAGLFYSPIFFEYFGTKKSLNVCAFTETFCPEAIERFQEKTGVKVNLTYVELDEQIFAKFNVNGGSGYDVLNVSDFMVHKLGQMNLLQQINKDSLANVGRINKNLLRRNFDPENTLSLPHKWFMYGILYDTKFFNCDPDDMSLEYIFETPSALAGQYKVPFPYKVCMIDSPLDAFFFASTYLYGGYEDLDDQQYQHVGELMVKQKQWVECYTLYTIEYFVTKGIVPIALTSSNFVRKIWEWTDRFDFSIPREGGMLVVENLVIPKKSKNTELAHQFIDFMLSDEIALLNSSEYGWASANKYANDSVDERYQKSSHLFPTESLFKRLSIPLYSADMRAKVDEIWLEVGFS